MNFLEDPNFTEASSEGEVMSKEGRVGYAMNAPIWVSTRSCHWQNKGQ